MTLVRPSRMNVSRGSKPADLANQHEKSVASRGVRLGTGRTRGSIAVLALAAAVTTFLGANGLGGAPHPLEPAETLAAHFVAQEGSIYIGAVFGYLGAAALAALFLVIAGGLTRSGRGTEATVVRAATIGVAGYFIAVHVIFTTLSYVVAASSPEATKSLFGLTMLGIPVFGTSVAVAIATAALGSRRGFGAPRWWVAASILGAAVAAIASFSYADSGFFSPDVQQQSTTGVLTIWLLITAGVSMRKVRVHEEDTASWRTTWRDDPFDDAR